MPPRNSQGATGKSSRSKISDFASSKFVGDSDGESPLPELPSPSAAVRAGSQGYKAAATKRMQTLQAHDAHMNGFDGLTSQSAIDLTYTPSAYTISDSAVPTFSDLAGSVAAQTVKLASVETDKLRALLRDITTLQHAAKNRALALESDLRQLTSLQPGHSLDNERWYMQCMQTLHGTDIDADTSLQIPHSSAPHDLISPRSKGGSASKLLSVATASPVSSYPSTPTAGKNVRQETTSSRVEANGSASSAARPKAKNGRGRPRIKQQQGDSTETESDLSDSDLDTGVSATIQSITKRQNKPKNRRRKDHSVAAAPAVTEQEPTSPTALANQRNTSTHWFNWLDEYFAYPSIQQVALLKPIENINNEPEMKIPPIDADVRQSQKLINSCVVKPPKPKDVDIDPSASLELGDDTIRLTNESTDTDSLKLTAPDDLPNDTAAAAPSPPAKKKELKIPAKDIKINGIYDVKLKKQVNELDRMLVEHQTDDMNIRAYTQHKHTVSQRLLGALIHNPNAPSQQSYNPYTFSDLLARRGKARTKSKRQRGDADGVAPLEERVRMELQSLNLLDLGEVENLLENRADDDVTMKIRELQDTLRTLHKQNQQHRQHLHPMAAALLGREQKLPHLVQLQQRVGRTAEKKRKKPMDEGAVAAMIHEYQSYKRNVGDRVTFTGYDPNPFYQRGIPPQVLARMPEPKSYWQTLVGYEPDWYQQIQQHDEHAHLYNPTHPLVYTPPASSTPLLVGQSSTASVTSASPAATPLMASMPAQGRHVTTAIMSNGRINASPSPSPTHRAYSTMQHMPMAQEHSMPSTQMLPHAALAMHAPPAALPPTHHNMPQHRHMQSLPDLEYPPTTQLHPAAAQALNHTQLLQPQSMDQSLAQLQRSPTQYNGSGEISMLDTNQLNPHDEWAMHTAPAIGNLGGMGSITLSNAVADDELFGL